MSRWNAVKAKQVLAALLRIGWEVAWQKGSHRRLKRPGWPNYTFAFHDSEEIGPSDINLAARSKRAFGIPCLDPGCYYFIA